MAKKKIVIDTSMLIGGLTILDEIKDEYVFVLPSVVADEIDHQKESSDNQRSFKARRARRWFESNQDNFEFIISDKVSSSIPNHFDEELNDNKILSIAYTLKLPLATLDLGLRLKALSVDVEVLSSENTSDEKYKGYKYIDLDFTDSEDMVDYCNMLDNPKENVFNALINEYIIFRDLSKQIDENEYEVVDKRRWNGEQYVKLKLPKKDKKMLIKPKNELQECALDLLNDTSVPIKFVLGKMGSGKSFITVKMALYHVKDLGNYSKIVAVRNVDTLYDSTGYLKGSFDDKTDMFFLPFMQHFNGNEFEFAQMLAQGQLEKTIPQFVKGLSIGSAFIHVDEAEDLTMKLIKGLGTRLEETSCICFTGDYKQSESKFSSNDSLREIVEILKNNKLVGIVDLREDVRSMASRLFADIE